MDTVGIVILVFVMIIFLFFLGGILWMFLYPPTPPPPLPSPNNLSATFANSSSNFVSVQLNWSPVPGATQYIINYSTPQTFGSNNTYLGTITQSSFLAKICPYITVTHSWLQLIMAVFLVRLHR